MGELDSRDKAEEAELRGDAVLPLLLTARFYVLYSRPSYCFQAIYFISVARQKTRDFSHEMNAV